MRVNRKEFARAAVSLGLLVFMMLWLSGTFVSKVEPGRVMSEKPKADKEKVFVVKKEKFPIEIEQIGTIRTSRDTWVSSRIMAQVKEILVPVGSFVKGPDLSDPTIIARLDDREIRARLQQAESQLKGAKKTFEMSKSQLLVAKANLESARAYRDRALKDYNRYQDLYKNQAATGQQLDQMKAQYQAAEASYAAALSQVQAAQADVSRMEANVAQAEAILRETMTMLDYTVIKAPFSGKLVKRAVEVGSMVSPGQQLFYIETHNQPELHAWVAESLLPYIQVGQVIPVYIDALDRNFQGTIKEVIPQSDINTRTVLVKVGLPPDENIVNGLYGRFGVTAGSYETLIIPKEAVHRVGQIRLVYVTKKDGTLSRRFVTVGKSHGTMLEVLTGLNEGEGVVVE